jgi:proline iminopeptidase
VVLHSVTVGEEWPVVVGIPGGPGFDHGFIRPALDGFADVARVVYVDPRNTGGSPQAPIETCTLEQTADDVAETCAALGLDRVVAFGHSAGGFYALHLALRHPQLVVGLILCETGATVAPEDDDRPPPSLLERAGPEAAAVAARMFGGDPSPETGMAFATQVAPFYSGPTHMDVPPAIFSRSTLNGEVMQYFFTVLAPRYDLRPQLGEIAVPVLVTVGAWDWVVAPVRGRGLAAAIPDAALVEFEESGHFPFAEEPERWQRVVREYLARIGRS